MHEDGEVCNILFEFHVGCLEVDAVHDADHDVVD